MTAPSPAVPPIFVSHSSLDNAFCRPFVSHLSAALGLADTGHIFFDERSLRVGDDWLDRIQREVLARPIFIVILTPRSVVADYVRQETRLALRETIKKQRERLLIPVLAEACDPNLLAPLLMNFQMADCTHADDDDAVTRLATALRQWAASVASPASPSHPASDHFAESAQDARVRQLVDDVHAAMRAGHWSDAIARAELALSLPQHARNASLLADLALAYAELQRWEQAWAAAQRAVDLDAFAVTAWRVLAKAASAQGKRDEAITALDRARAALPAHDVAARLDVLAERRALLVRAERWQEAVDTLNEEWRLAPGDQARSLLLTDLLRRARIETKLSLPELAPNGQYSQWPTIQAHADH